MTDETLEVVDTAPPGTYPDDIISFDAGADDSDERPEHDPDEPWDEFDAEGLEELEGPLSFGGPVALEDDASFERWLQSALKALVAPELTVDGELGPRTRVAVKTFQRRVRELRPGAAALGVDGIAGAKTVAELELQTGTKATTRHEGDDVETPVIDDQTPIEDASAPIDCPTETTTTPTQTAAPAGTLTIVEELVDGTVEYAVSDGDSTVRFSYWTPNYRKYKPYNVSAYTGERKNLVPDRDILAAGYGQSELLILKANALKESGGKFGAINTWDDQIVSWGMAQFAGHAGTLAALMADLKDNARSKAAYQRCFAANGIDVAYGAYPWKQTTKTGYHVVVSSPEGVKRGDDGWQYIRTQPRLIGAFLLAGNDAALQLGQMVFWRRSFLLKAIQKVIGRKDDGSSKGGAVTRYLTSERGLALIVRLHNWMPANVVTWSNRFLAQLQQKHSAADVYDPGTWDVYTDLEKEFAQLLSDERKKVKSGSYDKYALDLSRARGSFVGQRSMA